MHGADSLERAKHCSLAGLAKEVLEPLVEDIWLAAHFLNVANPDSLVSTREPLKMAVLPRILSRYVQVVVSALYCQRH